MNAALGWHDGLRVDFDMRVTPPASRLPAGAGESLDVEGRHG